MPTTLTSSHNQELPKSSFSFRVRFSEHVFFFPKAACGRASQSYNRDTASRFSLMMVSMTTWKTTWMLEVSVAVVKWW